MDKLWNKPNKVLLNTHKLYNISPGISLVYNILV